MRFPDYPLRERLVPDSFDEEESFFLSEPVEVDLDDELSDTEEEKTAATEKAGEVAWPNYPPLRLDQPKPPPGQPGGWLESDPLPEADVLVITWTADEARAMHDVLAKDPPPHDPEKKWQEIWYPYTRNFWRVYQDLWDHRLTQWQNKSSLQTPSLNENRPNSYRRGVFGRFCRVSIGDRVALLFQSGLHLNTDGRKIPLAALLEQLLDEVKPSLVLSVGTAGGTDPDHNLGDVVVTNRALFHLSDEFTDASFNHYLYASSWTPPTALVGEANKLLRQVSEGALWPPTPQYERLMPEPIVPKACEPVIRISDQPIVTTDRFEYGTTENNLQRLGCAVEMGDAVVAKVCLEKGVRFGVVRNLSDTVINGKLPGSLQGTYANNVYKTQGYATSVNSSVAVWAMIAGEIAEGRPAGGSPDPGPVPEYRRPPDIPRTATASITLTPVAWTEGEPRPEPVGLPPATGLPGARLWAPLPRADALIFVWNEPGLAAVQQVFFNSPDDNYKSWAWYERDTHEIFRELFLQDQLRRDRTDYLAVQGLTIRNKSKAAHLGRYRLAGVADKKVLLLHTSLSIRNDGASLPIRRLVGQAMAEVDPKVVLSLGTAAAVTEADSVLGSVLIATSATYWLGNEFKGFSENGRTYGSNWNVPTVYQAAAEAKMAPVDWPELVVPTVSYPEPQTPLIPETKPPWIQLVDRPMLTAPRRYSTGFFYMNLFVVGTNKNGLDRYGAAIETRDAVVAHQAAEQNKNFASIRSIAVPMMNYSKGKTRLIRDWAQYFENRAQRPCSYNAALAAWSIVAGM